MQQAQDRQVGEFLKTAKDRVVFVTLDGDRLDLISVKQTPTDQLERSFPVVVQGTLYAHFHATDDTEASVKFVHPNPSPELREQVCREAALGMMDNPHFR